MDKIEEQVKELRAYSNVSLYAREDKARELLNEAADTIESLSEKLQATNMESDLIKRESVLKLIEDIKCNPDLPKNYGTLLDIMREVRAIPAVYDSENIIKANMERTAEDCGGWIPCKERLPEEKINPITKDFCEYQVTFKSEDVTDIRHYKFGRGHWWNGPGIMDEYVIAWRQNFEPYHEH